MIDDTFRHQFLAHFATIVHKRTPELLEADVAVVLQGLHGHVPDTKSDTFIAEGVITVVGQE